MFAKTLKPFMLASIAFAPILLAAWPTASAAQVQSYSNAESDLARALSVLAEDSGRTIIYSASDVAGKRAPRVVNAPTLETALALMLANSGLVAAPQQDGSILIETAVANRTARGHTEDIVVTGTRGNAAAIQLKSNTAISVLTTTDIARAPDTNVTETLSRLPGVNILYGGTNNTNGVSVDFAARGEGNLVAFRGLDPEYNGNFINGVDVAQGRPYSRGVELNLLPPLGLQTITVSKSFSADQNGDAIGGLVDFRTPTAFDFAAGSHGSFSTKGSLNSREADYRRSKLSYVLAGDYAFKSKSGSFGIYLGGYYDHHTFANSILDGEYPAAVNGQFAYAIADGNGKSAPGLNPEQNLVLEGLDAGVTIGDVKRYGGNISLDWKPSADVSAYLRATYAHNQVSQDTQYAQLYGQSDGYVQIGTTGTYRPNIPFIQPRYYFTTEPEESALGTVTAGLAIKSGKWKFAPNAFVSWGINNSNHIEVSGRQPEVGAGQIYGASSLFTYQNGVPILTVSAAELALIANIGAYGQRRSGEISPEFSNQTKYGAKFDGEYDVGGDVLKRIAFGVKLVSSVRNHSYRDYTTNKVFNSSTGVGPTLAQSGLLNGQVDQLVPGYYNFAAPLFSETALLAAFNQAVAAGGGLSNFTDACGDNLAINNDNCNTQRGFETIFSGYLLANLNFNNVEVTPGARFEHSYIKNYFWVVPQDSAGNELPGSFGSSHSSYDKILPSLQINYRPNRNAVYRASVSTSYVRPAFFQLGGGEQIQNSGGGASNGGTTSITIGNPNLKAIDSVNFDASGEWTNGRYASASIGVFYKKLSNFLYSQVNSFTNAVSSTDNGSTTITKPLNGGDGYVEGIEIAGRLQFRSMPAPFDGFGVGGNVTLEKSSVHLSATSGTTERLLNQPDFSANALLFYDKGPLQADLTLNHTGAYVSQYNDIGSIDRWVQANDRVDLHLGYTTPLKIRFDFGVANLLNTASYIATVGKSSSTIPSIILTGRTYSMTAKYTF